jgi:ankyrin repeat protein
MAADLTRIIEHDLPAVRRDWDNKAFLGELSIQGELSLRAANLAFIPRHIEEAMTEAVLHVDLSDNQLENLDVPAVARMKRLSSFDLRSNRLEEFPLSLLSLKNMTVLKLDNNLLSTLPPQVANLEALEVLSLSNNELFCIPSSLSKLTHLTTLVLNDNCLRYLPPELGEFVALKHLYLHGNAFSALPISFHYLDFLREFSLEWFRYTVPPLPRVLKGSIGEAMIGSLRALCAKLYKQKAKECGLVTFLGHFSDEIFSIDRVDEAGRSLLHSAACEGDCGVLQGLTEGRIHLDLLDRDDCSALILALREDRSRAVKLLLDQGADVNAGGGIMGSSLHLACFKIDPWVVRELLKRGARVNSRDCEGNSPLHIILGVYSKNRRKSQLIADMLMAAGSEANSLNNDKWAPIHLAARRGHADAIRWIVDVNKRHHRSNREQFDLDMLGGTHLWSALHLAGHAGHFSIVQTLVEAGAEVFVRNSDGRTPKQASKADLSLFKFLVRAEKESLKRQIAGGNDGVEEDVTRLETDDLKAEALRADKPEWYSYKALYSLYENADHESLRLVARETQQPSLQADALYMLARLEDFQAIKLFEQIALNPRSIEIVREEAHYALIAVSYHEVSSPAFQSMMGPKLMKRESSIRHSYSAKSLKNLLTR